VLLKFFFYLPFFWNSIAIFFMPFGNLSTATDALIRHHFDGQFNNLDTGLLDDKQELCFVF
jgi:hypothetical protein